MIFKACPRARESRGLKSPQGGSRGTMLRIIVISRIFEPPLRSSQRALSFHFLCEEFFLGLFGIRRFFLNFSLLLLLFVGGGNREYFYWISFVLRFLLLFNKLELGWPERGSTPPLFIPSPALTGLIQIDPVGQSTRKEYRPRSKRRWR